MSNFILTKKNVVKTTALLTTQGYSPLQDVIASDEEEQILVIDNNKKTFWLISHSSIDVTSAMIKSIHGETPKIIN